MGSGGSGGLARWVMIIGSPAGNLKTAATEEHKAKRAEVREARKAGQERCPRLVRAALALCWSMTSLTDFMGYSLRQTSAPTVMT